MSVSQVSSGLPSVTFGIITFPSDLVVAFAFTPFFADNSFNFIFLRALEQILQVTQYWL